MASRKHLAVCIRFNVFGSASFGDLHISISNVLTLICNKHHTSNARTVQLVPIELPHFSLALTTCKFNKTVANFYKLHYIVFYTSVNLQVLVCLL